MCKKEFAKSLGSSVILLLCSILLSWYQYVKIDHRKDKSQLELYRFKYVIRVLGRGVYIWCNPGVPSFFGWHIEELLRSKFIFQTLEKSLNNTIKIENLLVLVDPNSYMIFKINWITNTALSYIILWSESLPHNPFLNHLETKYCSILNKAKQN